MTDSDTLSVYVVGSQMQLLNAIEYRNSIDKSSRAILLLSSNLRKTIVNSKRVLKLASWHKVYTFPTIGIFQFNWRLDEFFRQTVARVYLPLVINPYLRKASCLILGHYQHNICRYFLKKHDSKTVILDDGIFSYQLPEIRKAELSGVSCAVKNTLLDKYRVWLWNSEKIPNRELTFFTVYNIRLETNDTLQKHSYRFMKSLAQEKEEEKGVYFIGSNLSEGGLLPEKYYTEYMHAIKEYYQGLKITYISKHSEDPDKLKSLQEKLGFHIIKPDVPFELFLINHSKRPAILSTFYSSAILHSAFLFGDVMKYELFKLDENQISKVQQDFVRSTYNYLLEDESFNLTLKDLNPLKSY